MTTCTNKELETMSTKQDLSILAIIIGAFCSLGAFPGSLFAQCNPPGANTKCWDGGGDGILWSKKLNWNPDDLPVSTDAVFHLIGGQIIMDRGDLNNPVPISSFVFDPDAGGSILINSNKNLFVTGSFASDVSVGASLYGLTLESRAVLDVFGQMNRVDVTLMQPIGGGGGLTKVNANGPIMAGNWTLEPGSKVNANFGIDLTAADPAARTWNVFGEVAVDGDVRGQGIWTVEQLPGLVSDVSVALGFEAQSLAVKGGASFHIGVLPVANELRISQQMVVDGSHIDQSFGRLVAEAGSTILITGGGTVVPGSLDAFGGPNEVDRVEYGLPGTSTNLFVPWEGLVLTESGSTLTKAEGADSNLLLQIRIGDLGIRSKIHAEASDWDSSGVVLELDTASLPHTLEVTSPDFDGIWFADSQCIKPWGGLNLGVAGTGVVGLVDNSVNANAVVNTATGKPEAMYVDGDIVIQTTPIPNSPAFTLNNSNLYYTGHMNVQCPGDAFPDAPHGCDFCPPGDICAPCVCPTLVIKTLYGDFDGSGSVSTDPADADRVRFNAAFPSPTDPYDALVDSNCDGTIDVKDRDHFVANWGDQGLECPNFLCDDGDVCTFDQCIGSTCSNVPNAYGDVDHNSVVNIFDLFCVLNGFSQTFADCPFSDVDIQPCTGNSVINIFDVFAILNAFNAIDPCCGGGGGGSAPGGGFPGSFATFTVTLSAVPSSGAAGDLFDVDVFGSDFADLRGYEVGLTASGGTTGGLTLENIVVDTLRSDYVFAGLMSPFQSVDTSTVRMLNALAEDVAASQTVKYLATFKFRASADASGTFTVSARPDPDTLAVDSTTTGMVTGQPSAIRET